MFKMLMEWFAWFERYFSFYYLTILFGLIIFLFYKNCKNLKNKIKLDLRILFLAFLLPTIFFSLFSPFSLDIDGRTHDYVISAKYFSEKAEFFRCIHGNRTSCFEPKFMDKPPGTPYVISLILSLTGANDNTVFLYSLMVSAATALLVFLISYNITRNYIISFICQLTYLTINMVIFFSTSWPAAMTSAFLVTLFIFVLLENEETSTETKDKKSMTKRKSSKLENFKQRSITQKTFKKIRNLFKRNKENIDKNKISLLAFLAIALAFMKTEYVIFVVLFFLLNRSYLRKMPKLRLVILFFFLSITISHAIYELPFHTPNDGKPYRALLPLENFFHLINNYNLPLFISVFFIFIVLHWVFFVCRGSFFLRNLALFGIITSFTYLMTENGKNPRYFVPLISIYLISGILVMYKNFIKNKKLIRRISLIMLLLFLFSNIFHLARIGPHEIDYSFSHKNFDDLLSNIPENQLVVLQTQTLFSRAIFTDNGHEYISCYRNSPEYILSQLKENNSFLLWTQDYEKEKQRLIKYLGLKHVQTQGAISIYKLNDSS